jgi:hypothetical protein
MRTYDMRYPWPLHKNMDIISIRWIGICKTKIDIILFSYSLPI